MDPLLRELVRDDRAYRRAEARADDLRTRRNRTLGRVLAARTSHAEIAQALGVNRARAGQLAKKAIQP